MNLTIRFDFAFMILQARIAPHILIACFSITMACVLITKGELMLRLCFGTLGRVLRECKIKSVSDVELDREQESLFERLRALRMEIARDEHVPPYIVFSDKSLTHMCILKPKTENELRKVSGVGAYKAEKYGERFLECIRQMD